ncbi:MAG: hypothetical protein HY270_10590 [Deltaproteobacteria bacterium]|nr:hypothetical protein [Deltaproteobacteria bacterium]
MRNRKAMGSRRDLAIASLMLGFVVMQLVQCSASAPHSTSQPQPAVQASPVREADEHESDATPGRGDEAQEEERAKIHGVARALQTIAANPEMQKTYGFKP